MTNMQKGVIILIKSAVTQEPQPLPEGFSIGEAYDFIIRHRVMMLAYDGAVRCGISRNEPAMQKLFQSYVSGMLRSEKQMKAVSEIYAAFDENDIDYLPLKGCNMKYLYPKPELRLMGDADILIKENQFSKVREALEKIGFEKGDGMDHHDAWHSDSLYLEIHKKPFSIANTEFFEYYGDGWKFAQKAENNRYRFSPEDEFIHLITHFAVHCRGGGIGLRHAVDFYVYKTACQNLDEEYIRRELEKLHLLKLYENTENLTESWFGGNKISEEAEMLSEFILSGGDWGSYRNAFLSQEVKSRKNNGEGKHSKFKSAMRIIFQPLSLMRVKYVKLQKYPFLLPFYWAKRWFEVLFFRRKNIARKAEMLKNSNGEKVREYEEMLRRTGIAE